MLFCVIATSIIHGNSTLLRVTIRRIINILHHTHAAVSCLFTYHSDGSVLSDTANHVSQLRARGARAPLCGAWLKSPYTFS